MSRYGEPFVAVPRGTDKTLLERRQVPDRKVPVEARSYAPTARPGQKAHPGLRHPIARKAETQKVLRHVEQQFRLYFKRAEQQKGVTGENLLSMLERRLDNAVFLLGFGRSRAHARQLIGHGHFQVNGRKVSVPSYILASGDEIAFKPRSAGSASAKELADLHRNKTIPGWLSADWDNMKGKVLSLPTRQDVTVSVEEHLVVELYSK